MTGAKCHYCGIQSNRFRVARAYLWCGICPLPMPDKEIVKAEIAFAGVPCTSETLANSEE